MTRNRKLFLNLVATFFNQIVFIASGFILPRYILGAYGSDVNGLLTSITQFLSVISFLELGLGPVIQSNLYKPLAEKNEKEISKILVSARRFYRKIAYIFLLYIVILCFVYPILNREFDPWFTASLIIIISVGSFMQYYLVQTYQILLTADQKVYIGQLVQIVSILLNTIASIVLVLNGCPIHIVKLVSASIFIFQPMVYSAYVRHNYQIDWTIRYEEEPIKQKWNGLFQHLAYVVCNEIAVILLTFSASYLDVSIYSVYFMVVHGISLLVAAFSSGIGSYWGDMIAKGETEVLKKSFVTVEIIMHCSVVFLFSCTAFLVGSFVQVYVSGIPDSAAYLVPLFGAVLAVGYGFNCLKIPYSTMATTAAGHYKQTQSGAFVSMLLNILISVVLIIWMDNKLVAVAIGTIAALLYYMVYFALYLRRHILNRNIIYFIKHMILDILQFIAIYFAVKGIHLGEPSYLSWFIMALKVAGLAFAVVFPSTVLVYYQEVADLVARIPWNRLGIHNSDKT